MKNHLLKITLFLILLVGGLCSCEKEKNEIVDMSGIDFSNIEDLYAQSLPVIQKCVQGKWQWYASYGGVMGENYSDNTFVDIYDDYYIITYNDGMQRVIYFTWKKCTVYYSEIETYVMWDTEHNQASWYFMSTKNDTLTLRSDPPPNSADIPSSFEFIKMK